MHWLVWWGLVMMGSSLSYGEGSISGKLRTKFWLKWGDFRTTITPYTEFKGIGIASGSK